MGSLFIPAIKKKDSGNYTCNPSNSPSVTIVLHVINGKWITSLIFLQLNQTVPWHFCVLFPKKHSILNIWSRKCVDQWPIMFISLLNIFQNRRKIERFPLQYDVWPLVCSVVFGEYNWPCISCKNHIKFNFNNIVLWKCYCYQRFIIINRNTIVWPGGVWICVWSKANGTMQNKMNIWLDTASKFPFNVDHIAYARRACIHNFQLHT